MKIAIGIVVILVVAGLGYYFMQSGDYSVTPSPTPTPTPASPTPTPTASTPQPTPTPPASSPTPSPSSALTASVNITGFLFGSPEIRVKKGTKVTWTNMDLAGHTVTADGSAFASGNLGQGKTFSHTFNTAGTFSYHCALHPSMTGKVIVE